MHIHPPGICVLCCTKAPKISDAPVRVARMELEDMHVSSGGYDVELFLDAPDENLMCSICRGVLRCPVRAVCQHLFCKNCIMQWLKRQESCPCCRKLLNHSMIYVMFKLSKTIGRMKIKCRNEIQGCRATFPLSEQFAHISECPFELVSCPQRGCGAQLLRRHLQLHAQHCQHRRQPCYMGCGALLSPRARASHNCYLRLRREYEARSRSQRVLVLALQRRMKKMQNAMAHMKKQITLICESLEVMDDLPEEVEGEEEAGEGDVGRSTSDC